MTDGKPSAASEERAGASVGPFLFSQAEGTPSPRAPVRTCCASAGARPSPSKESGEKLLTYKGVRL